jgi:peptide/nickel transport system substrate-binding protein
MKKKYIFIKNIFKKEGKKIFFFSLFFLFISLSWKALDGYLVEVPSAGGELIEVQIGTNLRFVNPVLTRSNAEKDLLPLIYSSVLKRDSSGNLRSGIAALTLSENRKEYTLKIEKDVFFSDGKNLTSNDVIFTIDKISDNQLNSPYYGNWFGVKYEKVSDYELKITLPEQYDQFSEILASLYILPKHLWQDFSPSEFDHNPININAVGSGPYIVKEVVRTESGKIQKYILEKNTKNYKKNIYIDKIIFYFFDNSEQYKESLLFKNKRVVKNIANVDPKIIESLSSKKSFTKHTIEKISTPRIFGLFLNQESNGFLKNGILRKAISEVVDKNNITSNSLGGYAKKANSPIFNFEYQDTEQDIEKTKKKLLKNNFTFVEKKDGKIVLMENKKNLPAKPVIINLTTIDSEEFISIAKNIKKDLEKIGIALNITHYKEDILANSIVRNRNFEILLFGYHTDINPDFYYLFHSSQITDPGINISNLKNTLLDKYLLELRKKTTVERKDILFGKIHEIIMSKNTFIPIYSPYFTYIMDSRIKNFNKKIINSREERFLNIEDWYIKKRKILP